jgi:hypothetical protein
MLAMVETNDATELLTKLNEQAEVIADLLDEIRTELQWGVRNRRIRIISMAADPCADDMRINEADQVTYCADCDTEVLNLAEAIRQGWTQLREGDGGFLGTCPGCAENNRVLDEAKPKDAETAAAISDVTKCESCEAEVESPPAALKAGWDTLGKGEHFHTGRCPGCQEAQNPEKGQLF